MTTPLPRIFFKKMTLVHFLILISIFLSSGCSVKSNNPFEGLDSVEEQTSSLTPGMTKKSIEKGKTNQATVMQTFGPPDYVTSTSSGGEMWGYDRVSREVASNAFGVGILGGGLPGGALIGGGVGAQAKNSSQTVKTMFLIIYFDQNDIVTDYKISATRF